MLGVRDTWPGKRSWLVVALVSAGLVDIGGCASDADVSSSSTSRGAGGGVGPLSVTSTGIGGAVCDPGLPSVDDDLDGFSQEEGDCNDCDPHVNPNAIEVIASPEDDLEPADENCNGLIDEPLEPCDDGLLIDSLDPNEAARALELCQQAGESADWGLVSAAYVNADGTPASPSLNVGLLPKFGDVLVPRAGEGMVGLSSGHARDASQPDNCGYLVCSLKPDGLAPPVFPQPVLYCPMPDDIEDDIALELVVRAPSNAQGYAFDFAFFSFEFPEYICTAFNDQFVALADPAPPDAINGNISFDAAGNPVSVNLGLLDHCDPASIVEYAKSCQMLSAQCPSPPVPYCARGPYLLAGTGFDVWDDFAGSTGWLTTTAPATGGEEIRVRFAIWDATDAGFDSTVIVDHFRWLAEPATVATIPAPR